MEENKENEKETIGLDDIQIYKFLENFDKINLIEEKITIQLKNSEVYDEYKSELNCLIKKISLYQNCTKSI